MFFLSNSKRGKLKMYMLIIILGLLIISAGLFLIFFYIRIMKRGECCEAKIAGIEEKGQSFGMGGSAHSILVKFEHEDENICAESLHTFYLIPAGVRRRLNRLQNKYIKKQVHIFYNPDNLKQILIKEFLWRIFIVPIFMTALGAFLLAVGIVSFIP